MTGLEARVESAVSRALADVGWWVPLSVRQRAAQAAVAVVWEWEAADPAVVYGGDLAAPLCCCKRGLMCAACGTGSHWRCPDRDDQDDHETSDGEEDGE